MLKGFKVKCPTNLQLLSRSYTLYFRVRVFRTHVRHFKLHLATILCPFYEGLGLIWRDYTLY